MNDRYSKLAFLHKVKERKTPSLSAQASFAPFSLKVAWSGKSVICFLCQSICPTSMPNLQKGLSLIFTVAIRMYRGSE